MFGYVRLFRRNDDLRDLFLGNVGNSADSRQVLPWTILKQVIRPNNIGEGDVQEIADLYWRDILKECSYIYFECKNEVVCIFR